MTEKKKAMVTAKTKNIIRQVKESGDSALKAVYEACCEKYRKRLHQQWGLDIRDSWWVADQIGDVLILNDCEYSLGMDDVRYFVDSKTSFEDFEEWWNYNMDEFYKEDEGRPVNVYSWFVNGYRPKN